MGDIETESAEDELDAQKNKPEAGKKALNDGHPNLDAAEAPRKIDDVHLYPKESDATPLPIREGLPRMEGESTLNVLLVEDNDINLQILIVHMKKAGYQYATAHNGLEALNTFKDHPAQFGVVLMGKFAAN